MPAHGYIFPPCPSSQCPTRPATANTSKPAATPEGETLELATAGAAKVLGADHGVTKALARASITMAKADLWRG